MAEVIASELVPDPATGNRDIFAREELISHGNAMGDFFTAEHISGWQYPVAETLCSFMIKSNKKNYVDFINGIKDGLSAQESLEQKYKARYRALSRRTAAPLTINNLAE